MKRGGKRQGAGRPTIEDKRVHITITLPIKVVSLLPAKGKSKFISTIVEEKINDYICGENQSV
jgi:hypothetical protein